MRIELTSVFVDDQRAALAFYTEVLGFTKHHDIPLGEASWLTVRSPEGGAELLLEPSDHPAVGPYRDALVADGTTVMVEWHGGFTLGGESISTKVMAAFEIDANGRINEMRETYDLRSVIDQIEAAGYAVP